MTLLYSERGLSRVWLMIAPVATIAMIITQIFLVGRGSDWWLWLVIGGLAQVFVWLQVTAGRTHVSVELTDQSLRCGDETLAVAEIAEILPGKAPDHQKKNAPIEGPEWLRAPAMGRLAHVPRRRYGVGLKLVDGSTVQAWARNDYALREALEPLVRSS